MTSILNRTLRTVSQGQSRHGCPEPQIEVRLPPADQILASIARFAMRTTAMQNG